MVCVGWGGFDWGNMFSAFPLCATVSCPDLTRLKLALGPNAKKAWGYFPAHGRNFPAKNGTYFMCKVLFMRNTVATFGLRAKIGSKSDILSVNAKQSTRWDLAV